MNPWIFVESEGMRADIGSNLFLRPCAQIALSISLITPKEVNFFGTVASPLPWATLVSHKSLITQSYHDLLFLQKLLYIVSRPIAPAKLQVR